jgi:hypothetical protein
MATQPIEGSAIAAFPPMPPMPAVTRILARFERDQLAGFIAVALDLLDTLDGDDDLEDEGEAEPDDEPEDDDPATGIEDDPRGCDPETDYGGEEYGEIEQMPNDVPTVPCFALEPDQSGKRAFVGYWNPGCFVGDPGPSLAG